MGELPCDDGHYCALNNLSGRAELPPKLCPAGSRCTLNTALKCDPGQFSPSGESRCFGCFGNKFADPDNNTCISCIESPAVTCINGFANVGENYFCSRCMNSSVPLRDLGSVDFDKCDSTEHCMTTLLANSLSVSTVCAEGRSGVLCGACKSGFGAVGPSCVKCPTGPQVPLLLGCAFLVFVAMFYKCVSTALKQARRGTRSQHLQMTVLKILVTFLYNTSLLTTYKLDWGALLLNLFGIGSAAATGDVSSVAMTSCLGVTLHNKVQLMCVAPFAAFVLPLPAYLWSRLNGWDTLFGASLTNAYRTTVKIALWLLHPAVLRLCVEALITRDIGGEEYVATDLSVRTSDTQYRDQTRRLGWGLFACYVVGFPAYVFGKMWFFRGLLRTAEAQKNLGLDFRGRWFYFYGTFKPKYFYWEAVAFSTKVLLTLISAYASASVEPGVPLFFATLVALGSFVLEFKYNTYTRSVEEQLMRASAFVLLALFLVAHGLVVGEKKPAFTAGLRASAGLMLLLLIVYFVVILSQQMIDKYGGACGRRLSRALRSSTIAQSSRTSQADADDQGEAVEMEVNPLSARSQREQNTAVHAGGSRPRHISSPTAESTAKSNANISEVTIKQNNKSISSDSDTSKWANSRNSIAI